MEWKKLATIKGIDAKIPIKGVDYYTNKDLRSISSSIKAELKKDIIITPQSIRNKLEELEGDARLDASAIKNIGKYASTTVYRTSSSTWGSITGTLSEQTDLVDYIDTKIATNDTSDNINAIVYAIALG